MLFFQLQHNNQKLQQQLTDTRAELTSANIMNMKLEAAVAQLVA